jgi:hypothetical protein
MNRFYAAALAALVTLGTFAIADEAPPIRQFDQKTLVLLGRYIYRDDQFAWKASDILAAKLTPDEAKKERLNGLWITHLSKGPSVVRFLRDGDGGPEVAYDVTFEGDGPGVLSVPQVRTMSEPELAQYRARKLALSSIPRRCSDHYNSVAITDLDGNWLVWTLAATTTAGEMMYGGHYRFTISKDGNSILHTDALSRACITIPPPDPSKGKPAMQVLVQLVSPIPVETTVWLSMQTDIPFVILTGPNDSDRWVVHKGAMSPLND